MLFRNGLRVLTNLWDVSGTERLEDRQKIGTRG